MLHFKNCSMKKEGRNVLFVGVQRVFSRHESVPGMHGPRDRVLRVIISMVGFHHKNLVTWGYQP